MGLADHLETPREGVSGVRCRTCLYVEEMDNTDADALRKMLEAPFGFPDSYVVQILESEGYTGLTAGQIGHHRRNHL